MPPPRAKLHKTTGRLKKINIVTTVPSVSLNPPVRNTSTQTNAHGDRNARTEAQTPGNSSPSTDSPNIEQFELELCWCIQTLENSLNSGDLNAKQVADAEKTLRALKSDNQPRVKKRQLMQANFGDYRKKMADEEKRLRVGNRSIQFVDSSATEQAKPGNKGFFVKKSFTQSLGATNFQFNFAVDAMEKLSIDKPKGGNDTSDVLPSSKGTSENTEAGIETGSSPNGIESAKQSGIAAIEPTHSNPFVQSKFITSENSFKFNFTID